MNDITGLFVIMSILYVVSIVIAGIMAYHIRDHWWSWEYFFRVTLGIGKRGKRKDGGAE